MTLSAIEEFLAKLPESYVKRLYFEPMTGCLLWIGAASRGERCGGYGSINVDGSSRQAHRVIWELLVGPIDGNLPLDHVKDRGCASKLCCAPWHLEPVTRSVNNRRSTCWQHAKFTAQHTAILPGSRILDLRRERRGVVVKIGSGKVRVRWDRDGNETAITRTKFHRVRERRSGYLIVEAREKRMDDRAGAAAMPISGTRTPAEQTDAAVHCGA